MTDPRRALPSVNSLLDSDALAPLVQLAPRTLLAAAVRSAIATVRQGDSPAPGTPEEWALLVGTRLAESARATLREVLNGTGVILHTNLGRAPLAVVALEAMQQASSGYSNLEYDLEVGGRGSRQTHCAALLRELTGAEDAIVVNNCAAAMLLILGVLASGREVIVSRGELIEIGGSFRVPDIMQRSGARLCEVGTTNRTHPRDYTAAVSAETAAILKVHRGNFTQEGFVAEASLEALAVLAADRRIPLLFDFGSGLLLSLESYGLTGEPTARDAISGGADIVAMSGDKLLGGPQAGIIVGKRALIEKMRRDPLLRALRVDKATIAALHATLQLYREPEHAVQAVPVLSMLTESEQTVRSRSERVVSALRTRGIAAETVESEASVGGGAFPSARIPSAAVWLHGDAHELERRARLAARGNGTEGVAIPVVGLVRRNRFLVDCRTIGDRQLHQLTDALTRCAGA